MLVLGAEARGGFRLLSSTFTLKAHLFTSGASYLLSTEGPALWLGQVRAKDKDEDQRNHSVWRTWHLFGVTWVLKTVTLLRTHVQVGPRTHVFPGVTHTPSTEA